MTCFAPSPRPSTSIWGAVQQADQLGPGIWSVMTASHGGIILSDQRQAAMPPALQIEGGSDEEDCDWALPILAFSSELDGQGSCSAGFLQLARDTAKCWHPDRFSAFTGEAVEEKISLSERFGLWLSFYPFDQDAYLNIVAHWLRSFGCSDPEIGRAEREALNWALMRGSRNGRVAWQFAKDWSGAHAPRSARRRK